MIAAIKGKIAKKEDNRVLLELSGLFYEITISAVVCGRVAKMLIGEELELIIYHYLNIDQNRGYPVMIGFNDELERDFFEKFISVSGIGPKAALRAFDKPIAQIAKAIEDGDLKYLQSLNGIGAQRAKQIVAQLQGKVGRFALMKDNEPVAAHRAPEIADEAKQILKRLGYNLKEIEQMVDKVVKEKPEIVVVEEFLNEIYRQKRVTI